MRTGYAQLLLSFTAFLTPATRAHFILKDTYIGESFLHRWYWETFDDPTHGRVNYVDRETALNTNLTYSASLGIPPLL